MVERPWLLHWHTQEAFRQLAEESGLVVRAVLDREGRPASVTAEHFVFLLTHPDLTNPDRASGIPRRRASYGRAQ